jgi:hypothetical protein
VCFRAIYIHDKRMKKPDEIGGNRNEKHRKSNQEHEGTDNWRRS